MPWKTFFLPRHPPRPAYERLAAIHCLGAGEVCGKGADAAAHTQGQDTTLALDLDAATAGFLLLCASASCQCHPVCCSWQLCRRVVTCAGTPGWLPLAYLPDIDDRYQLLPATCRHVVLLMLMMLLLMLPRLLLLQLPLRPQLEADAAAVGDSCSGIFCPKDTICPTLRFCPTGTSCPLPSLFREESSLVMQFLRGPWAMHRSHPRPPGHLCFPPNIQLVSMQSMKGIASTTNWIICQYHLHGRVCPPMAVWCESL